MARVGRTTRLIGHLGFQSEVPRYRGGEARDRALVAEDNDSEEAVRYARAAICRVSTSAIAMHVACGFTAVGLGKMLVSQM